MASDVFSDLRKSRKRMEIFFPILDAFFSTLSTSKFEEVVEEEVLKRIVVELKSHIKSSFLMFFIPADLHKHLQSSKEFDAKVVRNESLAFSEWVIKFHLFLHSKAVESSSLQAKEILQVLEDTVCGILELTAINDATAFASFVQSYLKLINQVIDFLNSEMNVNGELKITEFSHYTITHITHLHTSQAKANSDNDLITKGICLKLESMEQIEAIFVSLCKVLKRIKEFFILQLEVSEDPKFGSQFFSEMLNKAFSLKNFKVKVNCLDIYISSVGIETLRYFSNQSFLALFSLCTITFLKFSDNDEVGEMESVLIQGWKCLLKKLPSLDDSLGVVTSMVVDILTFLLRNICATTVQNWKNNLFQQVIPEVLEGFMRFGISNEPITTRDLFKYLFEFFETNSKLIHFKSPWITLITGVTIEELLTSHSQARSLSSEGSNFSHTSTITVATTSKSDISIDDNDDDTVSMDYEEEDVEASDHEPHEPLLERSVTSSYFMQNLWQHFVSTTSKKTSLDKDDVHVFTILCEVINHLHFSNKTLLMLNNVELKKISDFAKYCCESIEAQEADELTYRICIVSSFAKLNLYALVETEEKLDSNFVCSSLLKRWNGSIKSQTVERELLEAFDFSVDGLVYFDKDISLSERFQLFLLKCKQVDTVSDPLVDIFPFYWRLLDNQLAAKTLVEISPQLFPKFIGYCCCIASGKIGKPTWSQCDLFRFLSLSIFCDVCNGTSKEVAVVKSEPLEEILIRKFLSVIENSEDTESLLSLLNYSAIQFFNHVVTDNMKIIDAFFALFSLDISGANAALHKVIPSFVNRFSCNDRYGSLLLCFKRRFGSECNTLKKELRWSEIRHVIHFGSLVEGELLVEVLVYLVRRCWEKSYIKTEIWRLARMKKITVNELFIRCQPSLSVKIIDFLTVNYSESQNCSGYLQTFISSFSSDETQSSLSQISKQVVPHVIPYLIMQRTEKSLHLLKSVLPSDVAAKGDVTRLVSGYWFQIIKVIVNNLKTVEIDSALKYLQDLCKGKSLKDLFVEQSFDIKTYLFCNLRSHRDSAINLLTKLDYYENKQKKNEIQPSNKQPFTQKQFNEYFVKNMRPFFTVLNRILTNNDINIAEKIEALNSLVDILDSLESQKITTIEIPYKAALLSAFQYWQKYNLNWNKSSAMLFVQTIIDNWKSYINKHPSLNSQIIEISNVLVPLLPINAESTSQLFKSIIVDRSSEFSDSFIDLHFLPKDIPEMDIVHSTIKKHLDKSEADRVDLAKQIEQVIKNLASDNPEVKVRHLQHLRELLRTNRRSLQELRVPRKDESSDYVIQKLLKTLMGSCIPYDNLHLSIAECLGEIGAIDPGRVDLVNCQNTETKIMPFEVEDTSFAVMLISELSSILDDKRESRIHDCVYYAIQEVLKVYAVNTLKQDPIWTSLSEPLKNICSSLFTSKYAVQYDFDNISSMMESPIYNTNLDYKDWIFQWIVKLTTLILSDKPRKLFTSCLATVKHSCSFARFLLPFVLLYALKESDENNKKTWIIGEIQAIMKLSAGSAVGSTFPYPMSSPMESKLSISTTQLVEVQHLCVQTIFSVLDSLDKWVYSIKPLNQKEFGSRQHSTYSKIISAVKSFSKGLLKSDLSDLAFSCQSYARALRYMEKHMRGKVARMNYWETMQKYYAALDDADGVEGVTAKMSHTPSLKDAILAHEVKGQFQEVLSCCETGTKVDPTNIDYVKIQIRCLMNLDSPSTASNLALGCISSNSDWKNELRPYMVEAAWKLSSWSELQSLLEHDSCSNPEATLNVGIGKLFNFALRHEEESFNKTLKQLRQKEMNPIAAAAMESGAYIRGYSHLVRLHMLNDLEYGLRPLFIPRDQRDMKSLLREWRNRNSVVQSSLRFLEPIVNLQRIIVPIDNNNMDQCIQESAKSLLLSAKIARKSGHLQRAYNCILEAERGTEPHEIPISLRSQIIIERSKYHWAKGEQDSAVTHLQKGLITHLSNLNEHQSADAKRALMKVKLLYATYADQTSSLQSNDLIKLYDEVTKYSPNWEEPHFRLAIYYDKLLPTITEDKQKAETMVSIVKTYRNSLKYGAKHVNESVPRMLTVWFDLGSLCIPESARKKGPSVLYQSYCNDLTARIIENLLLETQSYYYMTSFPQLLSRICHPYVKIRDALIKLISKLMIEYPKQTFWMLVGTLNNTSTVAINLRRQQCHQILNEASKAKPSLSEYFEIAKQLSQQFIDLCNHSVKPFPMIPKIKNLLKAVNNSNNSNLENQFLLPYQRLMNVRLPSKWQKDLPKSKHYAAFAEAVYIFDICDDVQILTSLQKPKKITLVGSDGKKYVMMCKPKDDLRKDQRTMEFMNLVNFHLKKDPETRKRQLAIRTYTVVPLNHECGLVEWVDDLRGVREIIHNLYKSKDIDPNEFKKFVSTNSSLSASERIVRFKRAMKDMFEPAVFSKFFIRNFNDPTAWYLARLAYVRSCAVMSIVGYIIGLGDRHLENILINVVTGNLVHVDFNILFNRGEHLQFPELVPFRLTHNMIDAMGATGYEGAFRITCETTLRVMREQIDALMSVLKPFVYDPLLEGKDDKKTKSGSKYEVIPEQALGNVNNIEDRLKGLPRLGDKQMGRTPISVSGQVSYLIEEATNVQNLGAMYVGWAPYF